MTATGGEKFDFVAAGNCFKELPDGFDFHELLGFGFHFFDGVVEFQRFGIARGECALKIAFETEVPDEQHLRVDVAPDFSEVRDRDDFPVGIWRR